ncbi:MAGE-domain-containing protein [Aspergillus steynii IBT 23096]|uniref:MAGE-domain-containing protein n=1 Tax=Aspergillus steynii IBT 23096 TaxID=1392250 RepID=A0A2I2G215_9EURO|nr:MAGE-domain-containing protein [Aspergillus steynii IBT 23096]PLB46907.1 MAGE-domain-containing protein [Aspergillus steynii IBT 23096]
MGDTPVNGEQPHSYFFDHLTSYPVVSDSITVFKSNKYGAKSLAYADQGYVYIAKPFIPYLSKPYGFVAPYVARVDSLGDLGLTKIDSTFPFIKQDTETLRATIHDGAYFPVRLVGDAKVHVFDLYGSEYKKCGGDGVLARGKAVITTSLVLGQESLGFVSSLLQKKKAQVKDAPDSHVSAENARRRRRTDNASSDSEDGEDDDARAPSSTDVTVKKLVRLALASEYSRLPIRRTDIATKVLGDQGSRQFKTVFNAAQEALRTSFGMELTELPVKEKVSIQQRRAAQKVERTSSSNKSWILTSTLPAAYRKPEILPPTKAPLEGTYTGIYSFIIALILLNGGSLPEQKLDRYLRRTNAETYTPVDRTDRLLQRLCKEGYLVRVREMDGGEEVIEYMVGPRGKMEVGAQGVAGLVRQVYGRQDPREEDTTPAERAQMEEFELRLARSLGLRKPSRRVDEDRTGDENGADTPQRGQTQRQSQRQAAESDEEDESD